MEDSTIQKINDYIDEFFFVVRGEVISNPQEKIPFSCDMTISRQALKHVVERRSVNDGMNIDGVKRLLGKAQAIVANPELMIQNVSERYPDSYLFGGLDSAMGKAIMVVVDYVDEERPCVITIFLKERRQFLKLIKKSS
jgi:hypothetical protein